MAANTIFKLMAFSILLNFSVGIMMTAIPGAFTVENRMGLSYNESYSNQFESGMNKSIEPSNDISNSGDAIYRVLDTLNLGFIYRFIQMVNLYLFGFIQVLEVLLGAALGPALSTMLFGSLRVILTIGYMIGAWMLWTGKDVSD